MEALLKQAGATLDDLCALTAYVRDPADHAAALQWMSQRFPSTPMHVVIAPVCRPGWLIEVEGLAIVPADNPELPAF